MEDIYISRTTQCTNTGQVSACSQEPVDSTDANIVETSTSLKTGSCSAAPLNVQSSYTAIKYIANWRGLGASYRCYNLSKSSFREGINNGVWK